MMSFKEMVTSNSTTQDQVNVTSTTINNPGNSDSDDNITLIVVLVVSLIVLFLIVGGVIYFFLQRRKKMKSQDGQHGTIFWQGGSEENTHSRSSKESGAYRSYDAINMDIVKDIPLETVEKRVDRLQEQTVMERRSKDSNVSGAYRSFDDLENILPDTNIQEYDSDMFLNRVSNYDFEVSVRTTPAFSSKKVDRHSVPVGYQLENYIHTRSLKRSNSVEAIKSSEVCDHTHRVIDNPLFSEAGHFDQ